MKCKYCDTELSDAQAVCPSCGHAVEGRTPPSAPQDKPRFPKSTRQRVIFFGALAVLLALLGVILWQSLKGGGPHAQQMQREVVVCDDFKLSNTELGYYFWSEYFYFVGTYGENLPASLDTKKPLREQMYDEEITWYDYILEKSLETVRSTMSMVFQAQQADFAMPEDYEEALQTVLSKFDNDAKEKGFVTESGEADVQAYLADSYGAGATVASFETYLRYSHLAAAYSDALYAEPAFTAQEISDYYDQYAGEYTENGLQKDNEKLRSLRVVLIAPKDADSEQSSMTAKDSAENLYAAWQADSGTEEDFKALAAAHSADPQSGADGGLWQDVRKQDLTGELAQWTFDATRKAGDTTVAATDGGWAIAYFVGVSERTAWQKQVEEDLRSETYQNAFRTVSDGYEFLVDYKGVEIATPNGLYDSAAENVAKPAVND